MSKSLPKPASHVAALRGEPNVMGNGGDTTVPANPGAAAPGPIPPDVVKQIAMDIGKAVAHHIETMYPAAVEATTKNMLVSVRNCTHNEIMAALETTDEAEILARLKRRKKQRRQMTAAYRNLRDEPAARDLDLDVRQTPPADLLEALAAILGAERAAVLVGEDFGMLTMAMEAAAIRCFRDRRPEDRHAEVLRQAFADVAAGKL